METILEQITNYVTTLGRINQQILASAFSSSSSSQMYYKIFPRKISKAKDSMKFAPRDIAVRVAQRSEAAGEVGEAPIHRERHKGGTRHSSKNNKKNKRGKRVKNSRKRKTNNRKSKTRKNN